jgi:acyl-CoA dehydrogenase
MYVTTIDEFRQEVREWLEANCPHSIRQPYSSEADACWGGRNFEFQSDDQEHWLVSMAKKGWTVPTWPEEYGGAGLDGKHHKVLKEELRRIKARNPLESFGISMLGPALLKFGSEELKQQHLPRIARGEIRWAQGYSEPNAGSDLASLQMRADDKGDHYLVNGSKVWTSYGDLGDWMFCLVRTNFEGKRHNGISFVLFDMATQGVSTKPIKLISGKSPFTETFLDDVRVEKNQVVGELNRGWTVAKYLLTHEREMIGGSGLSRSGTTRVSQIAVEQMGTSNAILNNSMLRTDIARFEMDEQCLQLSIERARDETKAGVSLGAASSMFKYYGTELNKRRYELLMAIGGSDALIWEGEESQSGQLPKSWLRTKGNSIEGGTSEIQLNIVAKHMLGLPG